MRLNLITDQKWISERANQSYKIKNVEYIRRLNYVIRKACEDLDFEGVIQYKNGDSIDEITEPFMYCNYGSPDPHLCKLLPSGYGFTNFSPNDIYKKCEVLPGIHSKLYSVYSRGGFTRYTQPKTESSNLEKLPDNFILVTMQNTGPTVWYRKNFTELAEQIVYWSRENKRNVVFKWHNGCIDHDNPARWFSELREKSDYSFIEYRLPLKTLITKCDMLWTASSMSGIEALICNKPVSIFGVTEYMEMATVANTPDDAIKCSVPSDIEQWLTYYVTKYCINFYSKNCIERVKTRINAHFNLGVKLDELILQY